MDPNQTIAHYRVIAKIGEGGMGEVYRAMDTKLAREVAIKVIPEGFAEDAGRMARFTREAQVLASLNHPNIAAIYGVEERSLVMELVEGPTLEEHILRGPIPLAEALPICRQIAEALEYAHEKGIIHRDLKPANVKVTADAKVKVLDFGLAKAITNDAAQRANPTSSPTLTMRATMGGMIMGTAAYMSPEQARGVDVDRRADIWSFGVLFYEMLTGKKMFAGNTITDTLAAVLRSDPDWSALPPPTPPAIRRLLRRCLARDRKQRLPDIAVARLDIDEALNAPAESAPAHAAPLPATPLPASTARAGFRWWKAAAAVAGVVAIAAAAMEFRESPQQPLPVRFQIPAPENSSFGSTGLALSPDGRRIAFIADGADGENMLWVRPLDSLAPQALAGTEGADHRPFWSPDSRSLAFPVQGKLKRIDASGGPPQTLCEISGSVVDGSWSRDGVIVFAVANSGLFRVPQAGGEATQFTTLDASHGELGHLRPWFLPDGKHFLYLSRTRPQVDDAIYLATLDGKERKRLVSSQQGGVYVPPGGNSGSGLLLFLREGTLMAQPLTARAFDLAGEPYPVVEHVGFAHSMGFFSASSTGVLAYRSGGHSQLLWFDRQGKSLATLGPPGAYHYVALSPDGNRAAVSDAGGNRDIWVMDVERGVPTRFTFGSALDISPVWSRNGAKLLFASDLGAAGAAIYQKDSSGSGNEEQLLKSGTSLYPNDWSPDGRYLLYTALKARNELWLLPVAGAPRDRKPAPYLQGPFNQIQGQFSPDGHWVAYSSDESGSYQVYVQSFPAGDGKFQVSTVGGTQPRWRRDGKEMFYIGADSRLMAVDVKTAPKFEAGTPKALFDPQIQYGGSTSAPFYYDVAADGKRFLVNSVAALGEESAAPPITVVLNWRPQ